MISVVLPFVALNSPGRGIWYSDYRELAWERHMTIAITLLESVYSLIRDIPSDSLPA